MMVLLIIVHVIVCLALIMIVLLQSGRGAEMGAAFGGSSQTLFGGAGPAPFLSRITTIAAVVFLVTSLLLAYVSAKPGSSVVRDVPQQTETVPAQDAGNAPVQDTAPAAE
jgi:preprotein translocase subunit SecG